MSAGTKLRGLLGRKPAETGRDPRGAADPYPSSSSPSVWLVTVISVLTPDSRVTSK